MSTKPDFRVESFPKALHNCIYIYKPSYTFHDITTKETTVYCTSSPHLLLFCKSNQQKAWFLMSKLLIRVSQR